MKSTPLFILALLAIVGQACSGDEANPTPEQPNEAITTVIIQATNRDSLADVSTATWQQLLKPDGTPLNPEPDTTTAIINLKAGSIYNFTVLVLDKTKAPVDTISEEIYAENTIHHLFFQPLPANANNIVIPGTVASQFPLPLQVYDFDKDGNGIDVGLQGKMLGGSPRSGHLRVVLRHQPDGKQGGSYNAGDSDFDVTYRVNIY